VKAHELVIGGSITAHPQLSCGALTGSRGAVITALMTGASGGYMASLMPRRISHALAGQEVK
jgi:hypothetical protein